jgi:hypothetical protein
MCHGNRQEILSAGDDDRATADEHQCEGAYKFGEGCS